VQLQVPVDLRDHCRAFADGTARPLNRSGPDVAHGKDTGDAGFKRGRRCKPGVRGRVSAGEYKPIRIACDAAALQPLGLCVGADKKKEVPNIAVARLLVMEPTPADAQQATAPIASTSCATTTAA
jgi:hypothetical protein